ncbi:uncharacterized protein VTP21DRAFT_6859 [Calcarisporiella thermophila]|uniref:uncharacterized protein n=1 Tax=Calcarisporiella thermophila TaxID=911321 RepID=UPI003741F714
MANINKKFINTEQTVLSSANRAAPLSQAVVINDLVFCSGIIPQTPEGDLVEGDIQVKTRQIISNLKDVLSAAGTSLEKLVKVNVYLKDMGNFSSMNEAYNELLPEPKPARTCVQVANLPRNVDIEIECVAHL